jgi:hypothetical protein
MGDGLCVYTLSIYARVWVENGIACEKSRKERKAEICHISLKRHFGQKGMDAMIMRDTSNNKRLLRPVIRPISR